ncbi:MAG: hypothetical protein ACIAQZ_11140 [Sedimentisphaeraceae bacterium JB056]
MKKFVIIISLMMSVSVVFATDRIWTNGGGDQVFTNYLNWFDLASGYVFTSGDTPKIRMSGSDAPILSSDVTCGSLYLADTTDSIAEMYITGGTNSFSSSQIGYGSGSDATLYIQGGSTNFSSYYTIGGVGYGVVDVSDGVLTVNRSQLGQQTGSEGVLNVSGGEFNTTRYLNVGVIGTGTVNLTGGTLNIQGEQLRAGDGSTTGVGIVNVSGTGVLNVLNSYSVIGDNGYGEVNVSGGTVNVDRITLGYLDDPNSQGFVFVSGGEVNCNEYFTVGLSGEAGVEVSGGILNTNRMTIGQGVLGESYTTNGYVKVSGGVLNSDTHIEIGREGTAEFIIEGDAGTVNCALVEVSGTGNVEAILNGSAGIGKGLCAFAGIDMDGLNEIEVDGTFLIKEGAALDASFLTGTDTAGDYMVAASTEPMEYLPASEPDEDYALEIAAGDVTASILSSAAQTAGWTAELFNSGSGSAVVLNSPVTASEVVWSSAGANDVAIVESETIALSSTVAFNGAVVGDTSTGILNASTGADASFVNLTIGDDTAATGAMTVSGGSVDVESVAFIGKDGDATLEVSGGSFSAMNLLASTGTEASADIIVSGSAVFAVDNLLALSDGATMTVSGYQTTTTAAQLTIGNGGNLAFELDTTHGVGNGLVVAGNVVIDGTVSVSQLGGSRVEGTYTVLRALGDIFDNTDDLVDSPFVSYEIVQNGEYEELQVTFFTPEDCADVIAGGFALAADANHDCYVTIADFAIMASQWLSCNDPTDAECELAF